MTDQATTGLETKLLEATADTALEALDQAGPKAADLIQVWVKLGNAAAIAETAEAGTGALRKAARRGLNVLKSRGIAIPARTHVAQVGTPQDVKVDEAYMLAPDTTGSSLFVFSQRTATSRCRAAFVIINDMYGVQRVDNDELSQSKLQDRLDNAITNGIYRPVKVPPTWARWRVAAALQRQRERGVPEPLGLTTARELLHPVPADPPPHPLDEEGLVLDDEDARELAKNSGRLHQLPEFTGWFPTKAAVDEMMLRLGETIQPDEKPADGHVETQLEEQVKAAADRYFTPELRERIVRLMKDSALGVLSRAGEQTALEVVATMKAVEQCGLITDPPHEVPFLRGFFDKAVAYLVAQGKGSLRIPVRTRLPLDGAVPTHVAGTPDGGDAAAPEGENASAAAPSTDEAAGESDADAPAPSTDEATAD